MENIQNKFRQIDSFHLTSFFGLEYLEYFWKCHKHFSSFMTWHLQKYIRNYVKINWLKFRPKGGGLAGGMMIWISSSSSSESWTILQSLLQCPTSPHFPQHKFWGQFGLSWPLWTHFVQMTSLFWQFLFLTWSLSSPFELPGFYKMTKKFWVRLSIHSLENILFTSSSKGFFRFIID